MTLPMRTMCTGALPLPGMSRRAVLNRFGMGLGGIALANLVNPARLGAESSQDRGVLGEELHVPAASQAGHLSLHGWRAVADGDVRLQAAAQRSATASSLPDSVRQGQRLTGMSGNQSSLAAGRLAVQFRPAWRQRGVGQRPAAAHRQDRRRPVHRAIDVHRGHQPRSGDHVFPDRLADRRPAQHGLVA